MTARLRHLRYRELDGLARGRLDHLKSDLAQGDVSGLELQYTFTADNTTNQITVTGQDTLSGRCILEGVLPAGLEGGVIYWLADAGVDLYTLHPTKADAVAGTNAIDFTDNGTDPLSLILL